ncbi:MAG: Na+/H+ antiporter subunit G [Firmicutes bacterium]|nr:Na+/H+ antiporter subunit G [Bacillota bacterium]
MSEILTSLLILTGAFFLLVGTLGLLRFPDVYNRLHSVGKASTLGVVSTLLASVVYFWAQQSTLSVKQLAIVVFLYMSSPVGTHMMARAAHLIGIPLAKETQRDDLKKRRGSVPANE